MDYWDAIDYILALPDGERFSVGPHGATMSLEAMKAVLQKLGNPQNGRRTVHVTGSKGKGSTSTMITSILHEAGLKTALYTSPHLHDYVERLTFEMLPVSRFDFAEGVSEIRDAIEAVNDSDLGPISTFGVLTALFFHLCKKQNVQWQIVEVGLGGTHDATNVFTQKDAAVISAISLEHTAVLGDTCAEIARHKSGIITPGCTTVLAKQKDQAVLEVVREECKERGARLVDTNQFLIQPVAHDSNGQSFVVETNKRTHKLHSAMLGLHQLENACTAVATAEALMASEPALNELAIEDGVANAEISGRVEQLTLHPITVVDGAHNGDSVRALVSALERHFDYDDSIIIIGVNNDKNIDEMLAALRELEPKLVIATRSQSEKAMPAEQIAQKAQQQGLSCRVAQKISDAIDIAREFAELNDLVCITGSLYVAAEARENILSLPTMH